MKMSTTIMCMLLVVLAGICEATIVEWSTDDGGNGHLYEVVLVSEGIDWQSAQNAALTAGGYLATITSAAENAFVYSLASSNSSFWTPGRGETNLGPWLGGFQPDGSPEPDGNWQWVTGEPFVYTNWDPGEPNNHFHDGYENRLHFLAKDGLPMDST